MDLVSIVVPVYNAQSTVKRCIDSLISQIYENIEIILIDDCSLDNSLNICEQYLQKYPNVKLFANIKNCGVSKSRNIGVKKAKGKYICFVDSDDYVDQDYIKLLYDMRIEHGLMPICGCIFHDQYENKPPKEFSWSGDEGITSLGLAFQLKNELYFTALWNKLFDKSIIDKYYIKFDENLSMGEDLRFTLDYISVTNDDFVFVSKKTPYHYMRTNGNSLMSAFGDYKYLKSGYENLKKMKELVEKYNPNADEIFYNEVITLQNNFIYCTIRNRKLSLIKKYKINRKTKKGYSPLSFFRDYVKYLKEKVYERMQK